MYTVSQKCDIVEKKITFTVSVIYLVAIVY